MTIDKVSDIVDEFLNIADSIEEIQFPEHKLSISDDKEIRDLFRADLLLFTLRIAVEDSDIEDDQKDYLNAVLG